MQDLLEKFVTPLPLMGKAPANAFQAFQKYGNQPSPAIPDDVPDDPRSTNSPPRVDEVYCWWFEHPETRKTHICVRKVIGSILDIKLIEDTCISVSAKVKLLDEDLISISTAVGLPKEIVGYHLSQMDQIKETLIELKHPLIDQPVVALNSNTLVLVSFPMKSNNSLIFE